MPRIPFCRSVRKVIPAQLLEEASRFRVLGWPQEEERVLREVLSQDEIGASSLHSLKLKCDASLRLSLLLCQQGRSSAADKLLARMGYRIRLSDQIINYPYRSKLCPQSGVEAESVCVINGAVPTEVLEQLHTALGPSRAPFWAEHFYPEVGFFSYNFRLDSCATNLIEELILYLRPLVTRHFPDVASAHSAEWWMHSKSADQWQGHALHYDSNEHSATSSSDIAHPAVTSVVYLTEPSSSIFGPTLVLDQRLGGHHAGQGFLVPPRRGRVLLFNGRLLHGVLPGKPWEQISPLCSSSTDLRRLTLMIGWWTAPVRHRPCPDMASRGQGGPVVFESNMKPPMHEDPNWLWPRTLRPLGNLMRCQHQYQRCLVGKSPASVSPAWQEIAPPISNAVSELAREVPFALGGVFLLDHAQVDREAGRQLHESGQVIFVD